MRNKTMKALAKKSSSNDAFAGRSFRPKQGPVARSVPISPARSMLLQRKPICHHDGGCLRSASLIQAKLTFGQPNDKYEQEADRIADQVMRMPEPQVQAQAEEEEEELIQTKPLADQITPLIQRQIEPEEEEEKELLQAKLVDDAQVQRQEEEEEEEEEEEAVQAKRVNGKTASVDQRPASQVSSLRGSGQPLPRSVRNFYEPRFGYDFSKVRIYADSDAAEAARAVNARAYNLGNDIVFGAGHYAPRSNTHGVEYTWGQTLISD
jgi:hypothetical protein